MIPSSYKRYNLDSETSTYEPSHNGPPARSCPSLHPSSSSSCQSRENGEEKHPEDTSSYEPSSIGSSTNHSPEQPPSSCYSHLIDVIGQRKPEHIETLTRSEEEIDDSISAYSPVYSAALQDETRWDYDPALNGFKNRCQTTCKRTVMTGFRFRGHDHIATAIRCGQKTEAVVQAFMKEADMRGWTMSVVIPTNTKVTQEVMERKYITIPMEKKKQKESKHITKRREKNIIRASPVGSSSVMTNNQGGQETHGMLFIIGRGSLIPIPKHGLRCRPCLPGPPFLPCTPFVVKCGDCDNQNDSYSDHSDTASSTSTYDREEEEQKYEVWERKSDTPVAALVEDVVPGTKTFVCNTGWVRPACDGGSRQGRRSTPERLIFALPQYSFHWSDGNFMIGSLRAAIDEDKKHITISAPTLMSKVGNKYGLEDIGQEGIRNFFYWNSGEEDDNDVSSVCKGLTRPAGVRKYYEAKAKNIVTNISSGK